MVQLPLVITYKDSEGASYTASSNNILYLEVDIPKEEEATFENGTLLVNGVKQSPSKPKAGDRVSLTFNMENTGEKDYTDTKLYVNYVSGTGFEPVSAEPYQYVGTIKAGQKKSVTVNVIAGKDIAEGMNTLTMAYEYKDGYKKTRYSKVSVEELMGIAGYVEGDKNSHANPVILHKDNDYTNNVSGNLEWVDESDPRYTKYYNETAKKLNALGREYNKNWPQWMDWKLKEQVPEE
jgi:hypothetical protein